MKENFIKGNLKMENIGLITNIIDEKVNIYFEKMRKTFLDNIFISFEII